LSRINFDIVLYNSPFFENLVNEFHRISKYKRNIYRKIKNEEEYSKKLSNEERFILKDLSDKENRILLEILANKQWLKSTEDISYVFINEYKLELNPERFELLNSLHDEKLIQQEIKDL